MRPEERLIIELTREIREEKPSPPPAADWRKVLRLARANRLTGPVFDGLDQAGLLSSLPDDVQKGFEGEYLRQVAEIRSGLALAADLSGRLAAAGIPLILLRGLALGLTVYPRPFLRPFSDLDLLVAKSNLPQAKAILREAGLRPAPGTFPDRYFERHHLHLAYQHPETGLPVELHWALDHPYTLSRVEYPLLFASRREVSFEGLTIPILESGDRLITLCLHLSKHCPFLSELLKERDFPALLLRGRWLLWILDLRRTLLTVGERMNWDAVVARARRWNLAEETINGLRAAAAVYPDVPFPDLRLESRSRRPGLLRRELCRRQLIYLEYHRSSDRVTRFLFGLQSESIFRPVRILDLAGYLFPGSGWVKRSYRVKGFAVPRAVVRHAAGAVRRLLGNLLDYLYYRLRPW